MSLSVCIYVIMTWSAGKVDRFKLEQPLTEKKTDFGFVRKTIGPLYDYICICGICMKMFALMRREYVGS